MGAGQSSATKWERTIETLERDLEMARVKAAHPNMSYAELGKRYGMAKQSAHTAVQRAMRDTARANGTAVLQVELTKLDAMEVAAWAVLNANHIHISDGRVVKDDGVPITDHRPVLMAIGSLLRIAERRAKLLGLDAPTKQTITVIEESTLDAEIRKLEQQLTASSSDTDGHTT